MILMHIDHLVHPDALLFKQDTCDDIAARRNILFVIYAASRLGLNRVDAELYNYSMNFADFYEPEHDYVVENFLDYLRIYGFII